LDAQSYDAGDEEIKEKPGPMFGRKSVVDAGKLGFI